MKSLPLPTNAGFLTATQTVLPGSATAFAVGDFNGDGLKDVATVLFDNAGQAQLGVLLGAGNGSFQSPVLMSINFNASTDALYAADLNQDGKTDVILVHGGMNSGSLDVFLSSGGGSFAAGSNYSDTIPTLTGMVVADVNGDGFPDILLADGVGGIDSGATPQVATFLNNGNGTFGAQTTAVVSSSFSYAVFADVDGDGKLDLVTDTQVFLGTVGGYQSGIALPGATATLAQDGSVTVGKFNADSQPDVAVLDSISQTVTIYLNTGSATFQQGGTYWAGFAPQWVVAADVNGDGVDDLIVGDASSADITVLSGNGDGTFNPVAGGYAADGFLWTKPAIGDFNGDGRADVVLLQYEPNYSTGITFLQGYGDGSFRAANNYYSPKSNDGQPAYGVGVATADLNGDHVPDVVLGNAGGPSVGITVFVANSDGTLKPGANYGSGGYLEFVATADFNHDGNQDVVASELVSGDAYLFLGNGDGTLQAGQLITVSGGQGQGAGLVVGDFNKDGWPDIAMVAAPSTLYILLNNTVGGFNPPITYALSSSGWQVTAADLDGDSKLDLMVSMGLNYVAVLKGNGNGTFTAMPDVDLGAFYPDSIAVGDFNNDGLPDMAVSVDDSGGSMGIVTLLGNGDGTFQAPVLHASSNSGAAGSSAYPGQIRSTDLNRDGYLDLVFTNSGFGTVAVMYGNGDGTFNNPVEFPVGGWPYGITPVDMNGDGATDLIVGNDDYSGLTTLLNYGGATVSLSSSLNPSTNTDSVTFTATLTGIRGVSSFPAGTVTFKDGSTVLNSVALSGGVASLTVANLTAGTHVISAIYSGSSAFLSGSGSMVQTVNQASGGSYTLVATPTSATIHPGQSATFNITATPLNGFTGPISFDCGSVPSGLTCQFTPASVTISGPQAATTQLVVAASPTVLGENTGRPFGTMPIWASFAGMMFGAVVLESEQKRRRATLVVLLIIAMLAGTVMLTGCATAGGSAPQAAPISKAIHVTAKTSNGHTVQLQLVVYVQR